MLSSQILGLQELNNADYFPRSYNVIDTPPRPMTQDVTDTLRDNLQFLGLKDMGHFTIAPQDDLPLAQGTLMLIGPDEPQFWAIFRQSKAYQDDHENPLDHWSRHTLDEIAHTFCGHAVYPFGTTTHHPFHSWAIRTGRSHASPIGFLAHDDSGLLASFRGALILPWIIPQTTTPSPCQTCITQTCKTACPVGAFDSGYDVRKCKSYLAHNPDSDCVKTGCVARYICPTGHGKRQPAQAAFHMKAFLQ